MINIIQICEEKLHYYEFVKPIEDILRKNKIEFKTIQYKKLTEKHISNADKFIISGTSLKDNKFLENIDCFKWIKSNDKPILGICGGMHILGLTFNGKLKKQQEIGITKIRFKKELFDLKKTIEAYELHGYYTYSPEFEIIAESEKCPQVIKHKNKPFYGILFHPEVRNKELIASFINM